MCPQHYITYEMQMFLKVSLVMWSKWYSAVDRRRYSRHFKRWNGFVLKVRVSSFWVLLRNKLVISESSFACFNSCSAEERQGSGWLFPANFLSPQLPNLLKSIFKYCSWFSSAWNCYHFIHYCLKLIKRFHSWVHFWWGLPLP